MRVLLLGKNGQLGQAISKLTYNSDIEIIYFSRKHLDISDFENTRLEIIRINPDIVINATAYTNVDKAETDQYLANQINNLAVKNISKICADNNSWLIHVSTDYVFDGKSTIAYRENDVANPINIYGKTKYDGEISIRMSFCKYIIIRTSWLFSENGGNFLKTMMQLSKSKKVLKVIGDQIGTPTYTGDLANTIMTIVESIKNKRISSALYHYAGNVQCSWYEFANMIFDEANKLNVQTPETIHAISSKEYNSVACRPKLSSLDSDLICNTFDLNPSDCKSGIRKSLKNLL